MRRPARGTGDRTGRKRVDEHEQSLGVAAAIGGASVAAVAGVLTVVAQAQMGASWRIGVQAGERTELITHGLYAHVRNPIFTGMITFAAGLALLVPNAPTLVGAALAAAIIVAQVRMVEEPHLRSAHGAAYQVWAAHAGRFVPGIGRSLPAS